ncbi:hypothetical protein GEMRC1_003397 [Eukaryota sp. GEM-RC1]
MEEVEKEEEKEDGNETEKKAEEEDEEEISAGQLVKHVFHKQNTDFSKFDLKYGKFFNFSKDMVVSTVTLPRLIYFEESKIYEFIDPFVNYLDNFCNNSFYFLTDSCLKCSLMVENPSTNFELLFSNHVTSFLPALLSTLSPVKYLNSNVSTFNFQKLLDFSTVKSVFDESGVGQPPKELPFSTKMLKKRKLFKRTKVGH